MIFTTFLLIFDNFTPTLPDLGRIKSIWSKILFEDFKGVNLPGTRKDLNLGHIWPSPDFEKAKKSTFLGVGQKNKSFWFLARQINVILPKIGGFREKSGVAESILVVIWPWKHPFYP